MPMMGRRLPYVSEGTWVPGSINWLIPCVQALLAALAAFRSGDYLQPRPPGPMPPGLTVIEDALPLPLWGAMLLFFAMLVYIGLFGGWVWPIIAGHVCLAGLSGALGYGVFVNALMRSWPLGVIGVLLLIPGVLLGVSRWRRRRWVRFWLAISLVTCGGSLAVYGFGYEFRTGTDLCVAAVAHTAFAIGIAYIAYRRPPDLVS